MLSTHLVPLTDRFPSEKGRTYIGDVLRKRVLVVDNDDSTHEQLMKVFEAIDPEVRVDWAATAEEAEERLEDGESYSLILTDLLLPGDLSGMDLWEYCEENHPDVPFVLISEIGIHQFLEWIGPFRVCPLFLQKPFDLKDCKQVLQGVFGEEDEAEDVL